MNYKQGSCWRKWDLHVHTPESIGHQYGVGGKDPWEAFLHGLETLPADIKVIGVNDYIFIDGYRRLRQEKDAGRLPNIDLLLPVIELRLDKFGGSAGHLSRVNYHIIFSDEVSPENIEHQFLAALSSKYHISPQYYEIAKQWNAGPTRKSLEELGHLIIESCPPDKRGGLKTPLEEGFNNINFALEVVEQALQRHYFRDKFMRAIGKTEWADVKWNDHTIAEKKHLINSADLVLISAANPQELIKAKESLLTAGVNHRLVDCSDAHHLVDSQQKDRLGKCFTWIKADSSFRGLQHAVIEYDQRVYLGVEPPKLATVRENTTKFIKSLGFEKEASCELDEIWFENVSLSFNHDLIAIIGNKGSGKSALADTIGLLGNSRQENAFSFLNERRFRDPKENKAGYFYGLLEWENGAVTKKALGDSVDPESVERVKYIPQHCLETLCNETPGGAETSFDQEIKKVIFSHVPKADRLGHASIDDIIADKTESADSAIAYLKSQLEAVNDLVADLEHKMTREYRDALENQRGAKHEELTSLEKQRPAEIRKPDNDPSQKEKLEAITNEIVDCQDKITVLNQELETKTAEYDLCSRQLVNIDKALGLIEVFDKKYKSLKAECEPLLDGLSIDFDALVKAKVDTRPLTSKKASLQRSKDQLASLLDPDNADGPAHHSRLLKEQITALQLRLDKPNQDYQHYTEALRRWAEKKAAILGDETSVGSVKYLEKQIRDLDGLRVQLSGVRNQRMQLVRDIYSEISKLAHCYRELYEPIQKYIADHPLAKEKVPLIFEVSIVNTHFQAGFLEKINQRVAGSFAGVEDGERAIKDILARHDFNSSDSTVAFLMDIMEHICKDKRPAKANEERRIADQLKGGFHVSDLTIVDFIQGYMLI
jgi:hypothetical protein